MQEERNGSDTYSGFPSALYNLASGSFGFRLLLVGCRGNVLDSREGNGAAGENSS